MRASELMRTNFLCVSVDDRVSAVLGKLSAGKHHSAVVVDSRDRYVGLFDKDGCVRSRGDMLEMKVRGVVRKTSKLEESTDINRVAQLLRAADTHILPVLDKYKRVAGIVGARDVLIALSDKLRGMRVQDVATGFPVLLSEGDNIGKAIDTLKRKKVSRIPVVGADRKLVGIVTRFDLALGYTGRPVVRHGGAKGGWRSSPSIPKTAPPRSGSMLVGNIMNRQVQTVAPNTMLQAAVRKMADSNISDLVVVEDGFPVGMLTTKDVLKIVAP